MAINYKQNNNFKILSDLVSVYQEWLAGIFETLQVGKKPPAAPTIFQEWVENLSFENIDIEGRYAQQKEALLAADKKLAESAAILTIENIDVFSKHLREHLLGLHDYCQKVIFEHGGLDIMTGLKNSAVLHEDLKIEQERYARAGAPFCIALARIDDFETIEKTQSPEEADRIIRRFAELILESLRSYDEAYRISRNHFIMSLKQSDSVGGEKGLKRLRDIVESAQESCLIDGKKRVLSLSCVVASPVAEDDTHDMIDNLFVDLDKQIKEHGTVLPYQELSPLQRMLKKEGDES